MPAKCSTKGCSNSYKEGWRLFRTIGGLRCWECLTQAERSQFRRIYRMSDPSRRPLSEREARAQTRGD
jgi:hypothetical protein